MPKSHTATSTGLGSDDLDAILRETFGFQAFRAGQKEAIQTLLSEKALLAIQPTGHGKSILYQLPSKILPGLTLVVSPLLALMRDQERHLNERFGIPAAAINSDQDDQRNAQVRSDALAGRLKVLFVAPEQLDHVDRFSFIVNLPVSLLVIDEAHCISSWGHDFRPSYRLILQLVSGLMERQADLCVLGLTATANRKTEEDIVAQLSIAGRPVTVQRSTLERPNIALSVAGVRGLAAKLSAVAELVQKLPEGGLIYCATRESTEVVADYLQSVGISAVGYHAGRSSAEKNELQRAFLADKYRVVSATNALGMGIDKPNLRYIIHFDVPGSITAYYQEVGRCGRDGQEAQGILLFDPADKRIQDHFINSAQPTPEDFELVLSCVRSSQSSPGLMSIKRLTGLHPTRVTVVVSELVEQGFLRKSSVDGKQVYTCTQQPGSPVLERYRNQQVTRARELKGMMDYAGQSQGCRMGTLRGALGDTEVSGCGKCDLCRKVPLEIERDSAGIEGIESWLSKRPVPTPPMLRLKILQGYGLLSGKLRSQLFVGFMRARAESTLEDWGISPELLAILERHIDALASEHQIGCVMPIPSRTWGARDAVAQHLATRLGVPLMGATLSWRELPLKRQGELLNNDQRRYNVDKCMQVNEPWSLPKGTILLFDDYFGSGATLKEACLVLRSQIGQGQPILPLTIAAVQWRLGRSGMI